MNRRERRHEIRQHAKPPRVTKGSPELTSFPADRVLSPRWILPIILGIYFCLTAALIAQVPLGDAPDESAHLDYVEYIATNIQLPVFLNTPAPHYGYEFHQPPLYYVACAPLWKVAVATIGKVAAGYVCRLVSLLCGVLTLWLLWHSIRIMFPDDAVLAPLATGFAALWPLHQGVGAAAGNDALAGLICAAIFWSMARLSFESRENVRRDAMLIGIFFGLGMLTKSSCLAVGFAGGAATWHLSKRARNTKSAFQNSFVAVAIALLICGAWLTRNQILYGDPLAAKAFDIAFKQSSPRPQTVMAAMHVNLLEYIRAFFVVLFATCWGFFGGPNLAITALNPFGKPVTPDVAAVQANETLKALPMMLACATATVLAAWGFVKWGFAALRAKRGWDPRRIALLWWGVGLLLIFAVLAKFNLSYFQAQARYLHPALLPMALIFALGWRQLFITRRALMIFSGLFGAVLLLITLWNIVVWKTLV